MPEVNLSVRQQVSQAVRISDEFLLSPAKQNALAASYQERFFAPWRMSRTSVSPADAFWAVSGLGKKQGYAENLQPYPRERWEQIIAQQNMAAYPSMAIPAIITRNTALRAAPSLRPFFLDPAKPGEGFPFDYLQNSALWLGTPVLLVHASVDKAWYFIETAFAVGWVRAEDIAIAGEQFRVQYTVLTLAALLHDDLSLVSEQGLFLGQTHIGAVFPVLGEKDQRIRLGVPVRGANGTAELHSVVLARSDAARMPLALTSRNVATIADAMHGQLYGWGGMFENRDCSSTMRDLFAAFGLWLPRNSNQQAQVGQLIALDKLGPDEKIRSIRRTGLPFLSLIWLQGHIGLYLGTDPTGQPLMLHNMWGVRTDMPQGGQGRAIVGRLVISTLHPGEERPDVRQNAFLERVRGLSLLGQLE
ncbi:NlpC/P60 family N-terminal domain-containing protein [Desulfovibrionales bacterium]